MTGLYILKNYDRFMERRKGYVIFNERNTKIYKDKHKLENFVKVRYYLDNFKKSILMYNYYGGVTSMYNINTRPMPIRGTYG